MSTIEKGYISAILDGGKKVTVVPAFSSDVVSHELVVPFFLEKSLTVKMEVAYCWFQDDTGLILARMDGDWSRTLYEDVTIQADLSAKNVKASSGMSAGGISLRGHTHTDSTGGVTSKPVDSMATLGVARLGSMVLGEE